MKMVIDADAHANEPNDLFDRYLEKEFKEHGPKVVQIGQVQYWMVEGKLLPRPVGTFGHGTPNGYLFKKGKPDMAINSPGLDDVQGRLKDMDKEGIDVQVAYPNIMAMASHLGRRRSRGGHVPRLQQLYRGKIETLQWSSTRALPPSLYRSRTRRPRSCAARSKIWAGRHGGHRNGRAAESRRSVFRTVLSRSQRSRRCGGCPLDHRLLR